MNESLGLNNLWMEGYEYVQKIKIITYFELQPQAYFWEALVSSMTTLFMVFSVTYITWEQPN